MITVNIANIGDNVQVRGMFGKEFCQMIGKVIEIKPYRNVAVYISIKVPGGIFNARIRNEDVPRLITNFTKIGNKG